MTAFDGWPAAVELAGPSLRLEPLRVEHALEMVSVLADSELYAFIGGSAPSLSELEDRYRRQVVGRSPDGSALWFNWIVRDEDARAVGTVQATVSERGPGGVGAFVGPVAEIAWVIGTAFQGRGYAKRAAQLMVSWLQEQDVRAIVAHVHPDHLASAAVAGALGLSPTGLVEDGEARWQRDR